MKTPILFSMLAACGLATTLAAQTPVSDVVRANEQRAGRNLVAAAEAMPSARYGFKPTPAQMSFGDVIGHLSGGNDFICAGIGGVAAPKRAKLPETASKTEQVARLKETFLFCDSALAKVDDSQLSGKVPWFDGSQVSRAKMMFAATEDWADHYSQLAIYLRLNGLLPPTAKNKEE